MTTARDDHHTGRATATCGFVFGFAVGTFGPTVTASDEDHSSSTSSIPSP